jgi:hypothetical protein
MVTGPVGDESTNSINKLWCARASVGWCRKEAVVGEVPSECGQGRRAGYIVEKGHGR